MGLVSVVMDWRRKQALKQDLLMQLKKTPPGRGITLNNPSDPVVARAIIELLKEHPQTIEVLDNGFAITLMHKITLNAVAHSATVADVGRGLGIFDAKQLHDAGYGHGAELPPRLWRDGVPDDVNTAGKVMLDGKVS